MDRPAFDERMAALLLSFDDPVDETSVEGLIIDMAAQDGLAAKRTAALGWALRSQNRGGTIEIAGWLCAPIHEEPEGPLQLFNSVTNQCFGVIKKLRDGLWMSHWSPDLGFEMQPVANSLEAWTAAGWSLVPFDDEKEEDDATDHH